MNAEFRRNVWLELSPRRIVFMAGFLALAFFSASLANGGAFVFGPVAETASGLFWLIVIVWGARNAGLSVVSEIRDRTWDLQRLSAIGAADMTWGKLFGSTIYNWFGGAICLVVMLVYGIAHGTAAASVLDVIYYATAGVVAQAAAFLASLIAVRRRSSHSRLDVLIYQIVGILGSLGVLYVWEAADPAGALLLGRKPTDAIQWWGAALDARVFLLVSLAIFAAWILTGCYREMRRELQMRNGPLVWLGFLAFIGLYVAGFDAWLPTETNSTVHDVVALRLALATFTFGALAYVMVLLEAKDRVLYRWYGSEIASGHVGMALGRLQAWIMSWMAALAVGGLLAFQVASHGGEGPNNDPALIATLLGFFTRDMAIFVLFATTARRSNLAAVSTLLALYVLIPSILDGLGLKNALPLFYPQMDGPHLFGLIAAWTEAVAIAALAVSRIAITGTKAA